MPIDLTRSILVVLIPGAVATVPFLLWLALYTPVTLGYLSEYEVLANALVFVVVAIAGVNCESVGTHLEVGWDEEREHNYAVTANWYAYLSHQLENEPAGYRYMSRLATMLYFELSMLAASIPFSIGVSALLSSLLWDHRPYVAVGMLIGTLTAIHYFHKNAKQTHEVLCKTRRELNLRIDPEQALIYNGQVGKGSETQPVKG